MHSPVLPYLNDSQLGTRLCLGSSEAEQRRARLLRVAPGRRVDAVPTCNDTKISLGHVVSENPFALHPRNVLKQRSGRRKALHGLENHIIHIVSETPFALSVASIGP